MALDSQLVNLVAIDIAAAEKPQGRHWSYVILLRQVIRINMRAARW